jgi:hypothetical protein
MYVVWRTRTRKTNRWLVSLGMERSRLRIAVLVESVRTDVGPRQEFVAYLGSIDEGREREPSHQRRFWEQVERALDGAGISRADRTRIVRSVKTAVPRPREKGESQGNAPAGSPC